MQSFFVRLNPVEIGRVLQTAYHLRSNTPEDAQPTMRPKTALLKGIYPIFNAYPGS